VILHSQDLVNWRTLGGALPDLTKIGPDFNWDRMGRYNVGIYAPSLRYPDSKFWIFVNSFSGEGFWCCTATKITGPWTVTQIKDKNGKPLRTKCWTDPCPFWDDDGRAYLASSHPGKEWFGYLFEMKPDGSQLLDAEVDHLNLANIKYTYPEGGTLYSPFQSTEGNKIYKRNGYYYLVHIEFLNTGNGAGSYILRSKSLFGPKPDGSPGKAGDIGTYEIIMLGKDLPGQGAFVDTPDGRWFWIAQFKATQSDGRKPHLVPVTWIDDWPFPGGDIDRVKKQGKMVWEMKKPITGSSITLPQGSDDFSEKTLDPQWIWNHQPRAEKWSLTERSGFLRLHAFKAAGNGFFKTGIVICQRHLRSGKTVITALLDLAGMAEGQEGGLARFNGGRNFATLGIVRAAGKRVLKYTEDGKLQEDPDLELPAKTTAIWLRTIATSDDLATFAYSLDGKSYSPFGRIYKLRGGNYRGDRIGIYTFNMAGESGQLDVDSFDYGVINR